MVLFRRSSAGTPADTFGIHMPAVCALGLAPVGAAKPEKNHTHARYTPEDKALTSL